MERPGAIQFRLNGGAFSIASAGTFIGDWVEDLDGILALSLQAQFLYGSGGTSVTVYVQTSIDQGQTPIDIAALQFTTASATSIVNLSGLTPKTTPAVPSQQALAAGTCLDGVLGDRFRAVVVVVGTYAASTILNVTGVAK